MKQGGIDLKRSGRCRIRKSGVTGRRQPTSPHNSTTEDKVCHQKQMRNLQQVSEHHILPLCFELIWSKHTCFGEGQLPHLTPTQSPTISARGAPAYIVVKRTDRGISKTLSAAANPPSRQCKYHPDGIHCSQMPCLQTDMKKGVPTTHYA